MYDLGQLVTLTTTPTGADGNATTPAGLAVTVRQPDGSSVSPAVTHATDSYVATLTPTQPGRHLARWLSTDGWADTSVFDVWPADPRMLFSLDEARAALRMGRGRSVRDDQIRLYIAATTPVIEDIVGPVVPTPRTYLFDGGECAVLLPSAVVAGSVTVTVGGVATTDFVVNAAAGVVYAGTGTGWTFPFGRQNVAVTATVGMAVIPPNIKLAALEEFRFLWQIGQQAAHSGLSGDTSDEVFTPSGFAVPRRVIELCAPQQRIGAIG